MNTAKDEVRKLLERLPNDASLEDIQYQVYLLDEIARGSEKLEHDDDAITAKLDEVYAAESSALDPVFQSIQSRSVKKDGWK